MVNLGLTKFSVMKSHPKSKTGVDPPPPPQVLEIPFLTQ